MKNIKYKITGIIIGMIILGGVGYAINTTSTGYKLINNNSRVCIRNGYVKNSSPTNTYFVATSTTIEYNDFKNNPPSGVVFCGGQCCN